MFLPLRDVSGCEQTGTCKIKQWLNKWESIREWTPSSLSLSKSSSDKVPETETWYLTGAWWKRGDRRDVQNLQLVHVPVQYDGGSVHISGPGRRVHLREVVIDELADYRSFPHSGSTDHCDTQRLHHSWSPSSAPWTAATTTADVVVQKHSWPPLFKKINLYFVFFLFFFFLAVSLVEFNPPAAAAPLTSTH